MKPSRSVFLLAIALVIIALIPFRAYAAAPPRVVALADVASTPVEVAITSKHLTLLHFETGEVSMVAVGDPGLVSVTVKGADVLLKALTSSGSTNAFIWLGGRYTQWTLTVRQSAKDPRLIIVRDLAAGSGTRAESGKSPGGTVEGAKPATNRPAAETASGQVANDTLVRVTGGSPLPQPPSADTAPKHPEPGRAPDSEACGSAATLGHFVKTLTARQREFFGALLTEPSLATLQTLLLELGAQQRCDLLALLAAPATSAASTGGSAAPIASVPAQPEANTHETDQAEDRTTETTCGSAFPSSDSEGLQGGPLTPAGIVLAITPQMVDGRLFLYYVLENHGEVTLLTDILRLRISNSSGQRLGFGINRATQQSYLGRLETGGVEYGVIAVDTVAEGPRPGVESGWISLR